MPVNSALPDGFRQNARENCQNARKNAPAKNVKNFIAFLDVLEGVQKSIFKNISENYFKKITFLCSNILKCPKCATFLAFCAIREGTFKMRERGCQMRHFRAIAQNLAALPVIFFVFQSLYPSFSQREGRKRDFETGSRIPPRRIGHDIWRGKPSYDMGRVNSKLVFQKKTFFRFKIHTNMVKKVSLSQNYVSFEQL